MLAPIGISVYTRIDHFKNAISSLQKNELSSRSNLVVYSDAPSNTNDEKLVNEVRAYARQIDGFRSVTLIERPHNFGGVKNAHQAVLQLVRVFKQTIFIEDDIEVAPGFLTFMNQALDFYRDNPAITSISGYCPPLNIDHLLNNDFYVMNRFCGWGCGVFERTAEWLKAKISQSEFDAIEDHRVLCEFGDDVLEMVKREVSGELDAADVRCMFRQAIHKTGTIYPRYSLVQNMGHDGSGYHCGVSTRFHHDALWSKTAGFEFSDDPKVDEQIKEHQQNFRAFKGDYEVLQVLNNHKQSKSVALSYIGRLFKKDLTELLGASKDFRPKSIKIAILSTPWVGSTWLSHLLSAYFGRSIQREWLHNRYVEEYIALNPNSNAEDYLNFLKNDAFNDIDTFALHFHVNQVIAWKKNYGIDVLEFFDFDNVVHMTRKNEFEQVYSFAVASESGMWGSEVISALNLAKGFKVIVSRSAFDIAFKALENEKDYCLTKLMGHATDSIVYEELAKLPETCVKKIFEDKYHLSTKQNYSDIFVPAKASSIVCEENKKMLELYYESNYSQ